MKESGKDMLQAFVEGGRGDDQMARLTPRERKVLRAFAAGKRTREIVEELVIEVDTVNKHIKAVSAKLGVRGRIWAVVEARRLGLLEQ